MHDLRKKILLESGKTVSRKAKSRPSSNFGSVTHSPNSSPGHSRPGSQAPSRYASEDEGDSEDETIDSLANSVIASEDGDESTPNRSDNAQDRIKDCINEILDRKRSSVHGRESYLAAYVHLTRHNFSESITSLIESHLSELIPALQKSITGGRNRDETVAALKALTVTTLIAQSDSIHNRMFNTLKTVAESSEEESVKVEALYAMATTILAGGGQGGEDEQMEYLIEIIESDGHSIEAGDNAPVVTAALTTWGLLASELDDLQTQSEDALDAFTEQLDSSDVDVQMAAGTNIALVFEMARDYNEMMEAEHDQKQQSAREEARLKKEDFKPEDYNPFDLQHKQHQIVQKLTNLAKESSKAVSKKDRRSLHSRFNSILTSLDLGVGPGYSTAGRVARESDRGGNRVYDAEKTFVEFGYRDIVKGLQGMTLTIDSWALSIRVACLKKVLGGGFATHWHDNPTVHEIMGLD